MATLVCFHAHPDDEAISTGGTIARAAAEGHRVVVVFATRGELGELPGDLGSQTLAERREGEARAAAEILGAQRVSFLGYEDSGMEPGADASSRGRFCDADVEEAATRLAEILDEEQALVLIGYEPRGTSGHADHVQVHHVGRRAAEMAATPFLYEVAMNRDHFARLIRAARDGGLDIPSSPASIEDLGVPEAAITTTVDVRGYAMTKRAAMAAHASQIVETSVFLGVPDEFFPGTWGYEWYIQRWPAQEVDLFDALAGRASVRGSLDHPR